LGTKSITVEHSNLNDTLSNGYTVNELAGKVTAMTPKTFTDSDVVNIGLTIDDTLAGLSGTVTARLRNVDDYSMVIAGTVSSFDSSPAVIFASVHIGKYSLEIQDPTKGYAFMEINNNVISVDVPG
jgi:hypothetical protein